MTPLANIEKLANTYASDRAQLAGRVQTLEDEMQQAKRRAMPGIRRAVNRCAASHDALHLGISINPELFASPRTVIISGIRVGWAKGKGKLVFSDATKTCDLIAKHFPDKADELIKVTSAPIRKALATLSVADLQRIGCTVEDTGDQVVIKPTDSAVDKLVNALLADAEKNDEAA